MRGGGKLCCCWQFIHLPVLVRATREGISVFLSVVPMIASPSSEVFLDVVFFNNRRVGHLCLLGLRWMFFSSGFISRKKRRGPCFRFTGLLVVGGWFIMAWEKQKQRKLFPHVGLIVEVVYCTTRCLW